MRHRKVKGTREEGGAGHWPHLQVPEPALGNQSSGLSKMNAGIAISGLSSIPDPWNGLQSARGVGLGAGSRNEVNTKQISALR